MKLAIIIILITSLIISTILGIIDSSKKRDKYNLSYEEYEHFIKNASKLEKISYD